MQCRGPGLAMKGAVPSAFTKLLPHTKALTRATYSQGLDTCAVPTTAANYMETIVMYQYDCRQPDKWISLLCQQSPDVMVFVTCASLHTQECRQCRDNADVSLDSCLYTNIDSSCCGKSRWMPRRTFKSVTVMVRQMLSWQFLSSEQLFQEWLF